MGVVFVTRRPGESPTEPQSAKTPASQAVPGMGGDPLRQVIGQATEEESPARSQSTKLTPRLVERIRSRFREHADEWHAEILEEKTLARLGTSWLSATLDEAGAVMDGEAWSAPLTTEDFAFLDELEKSALADYLQSGLSWMREGPPTALAETERADLLEAVRRDPLAFPPEWALAVAWASSPPPPDSPLGRDLTEVRTRLLGLAASSLARRDELTHFVLWAMEDENVPLDTSLRFDASLVAPDIRVHDQVVADLNREYWELLARVASETSRGDEPDARD